VAGILSCENNPGEFSFAASPFLLLPSIAASAPLAAISPSLSLFRSRRPRSRRHRLIREPAGISRNQNAKRVRSFLHDARVHLVTTGSPRETGFPRAGREGRGRGQRRRQSYHAAARIYDIGPRLNCIVPDAIVSSSLRENLPP